MNFQILLLLLASSAHSLPWPVVRIKVEREMHVYTSEIQVKTSITSRLKGRKELGMPGSTLGKRRTKKKGEGLN